jgi:hypothetical protein
VDIVLTVQLAGIAFIHISTVGDEKSSKEIRREAFFKLQ